MYARGFDFGWFKNVSHSLTKWRYQFLTTYSILQHSRYISTRYTKVFLLFFTLTYIWQRDYWSSMFILSWKRSCESINFEITSKKKKWMEEEEKGTKQRWISQAIKIKLRALWTSQPVKNCKHLFFTFLDYTIPVYRNASVSFHLVGTRLTV